MFIKRIFNFLKHKVKGLIGKTEHTLNFTIMAESNNEVLAPALLKKAIEQTMAGMLDWMKSDALYVRHEETLEELPHAEVMTNPDVDFFEEYVKPRLEKIGIHVTSA